MTQRQDKHIAPPVVEVERPLPSRAWKKKYKCKKNKGNHTFAILHVRNRFYRGFWPNETDRGLSSWVTWACTACGKQDYEVFYDEKYLKSPSSWVWSDQKRYKKFDAVRPHSP